MPRTESEIASRRKPLAMLTAVARTGAHRLPIFWAALQVPRVRKLAAAIAVAVCAVAVCACGSSSRPSATASVVSGTAVRFADCMRLHGVSSFPDPGPNGFDLSRVDSESPAFQSAHQACVALAPAGGAQGSPAPESQRLVAIANAKCMRSHGVPNFPDPKFLASGGNTVSLDGLDTQSPAFLRARVACPWPPRG